MNLNLRLDWELLRQQKEWLLQHDCAESEGLLALIDDIQDQAVAAVPALESQVFAMVDN
jgi:hypothetical protein